MGIFKTELHRNPAALATNGGPWKGLDDLEIATCAWVSWFIVAKRRAGRFSQFGQLIPRDTANPDSRFKLRT